MEKKFALLLVFVLTVPSAIFSQSVETDAHTFLPLSDLAIPESLGKIQERFKASSNRTILQIQDVHAHRGAQGNIAAILEHLSAVCGIRRVGLEGAWTSTDLPKSRAIPTSREKQLLASSLLDEDYISGPVYAAILSPVALRLVGIEQADLYEQNRSLFLKHLEKQRAILEKITTYKDQLAAEQNRLWNPKLLLFGQAAGNFWETSDLGKFFAVLLQTASRESVLVPDLGQIALLQKIMAQEALLAKERLAAEAKQLIREYASSSSLNLEELLRSGRIPEEKLALYPEIKKWTGLFELKDQIALQELTRQIDLLATRVANQLAQKKEEKNLWKKTEHFYLAKKILLLKATPSDLKTLETEKEPLREEILAAGLAEDLELALKFYEAVRQRDEIFYQKLITDPELSGDVVIVTGGFHTDGLSQRFRDSGISYITITPELGKEQMNARLYEARMSEPKSGMVLKKQPTKEVRTAPRRQTLSELRNAIAWADKRFAASYQVLLATKDARKAVAAFIGNAPLSATASHRAASPSNLFDVTQFMAQTREEQLNIVHGWLQKLRTVHQKAMLVSEVSTLKKMLTDPTVPEMIEEIVRGNDIIALVQDVPTEEIPESLIAPRGIDRFEVKDLNRLLSATPKFQRLAKKYPFAIMKEGYSSDRYVVLPEQPISLILYRIIALNPNLYQAARNPEFLKLLQDLVTEALAKEATRKGA